jgi:N,N'-diacetyllegionaminate synthase
MKLIAEFCQNHNGNPDTLYRMIDAAQNAGCDFAKIQIIEASMLSNRKRFEEGITEDGKIKVIKRPYQNEYDRLKKLELSNDHIIRFLEICRTSGIEPMTTVFTTDSVQSAIDLGFKNVKIASYDCASPTLLKAVRNKFDFVVVSTGATFEHEIQEAAKILKGTNYALLHAVTKYTTQLEDFNLAKMTTLKNYSSVVGWSDHSNAELDGIQGTKAAIYFGAEIIERHFTILDRSSTKDGIVSITPQQASELKQFGTLTKEQQKQELLDEEVDLVKVFGAEFKDLTHEELLNRDYYRGRFVSKNRDGSQIFNWE